MAGSDQVSFVITAWGLFLERRGKLSGPVSHTVSPRKLYRFFSKLPLSSILLIFPVTCPVIYGRSWPPIKLPGSCKCCKAKQNGGWRRTFSFSANTTVLSKTLLSCRYGRLWGHWTISSLSRKNRVARLGNEGGIGKKHGETLPTGFRNAGKYLLFYF